MTVDCEQAANLISSRIDGELAVADEAVLDAHLAEGLEPEAADSRAVSRSSCSIIARR